MLAQGQVAQQIVPENEWLDTSFSSCSAVVDYTGLVAAACEEDGQPQPHRDKQIESPFQYLGLITRTISASSPEFYSKRGQEAIMAKVNDFRAESVWDESSVAEWSEVRHIQKDGFTPMSGLVFLITG